MEPITREQLDMLIDLQEKEREAVRLQAQLNRLPAEIAALEAGLAQYVNALETKKTEIADLKKAYRSQEGELEMNQSRVKKREAQLHAVKTNKEYQSLLKEIDDIRAASSRIEDASLQCLDDIDAAEKDMAALQSTYEAEAEKVSAEKRIIEAKAEELQQQKDALTAAADELVGQLEERLVARYAETKKRPGGLGIVQVENAVCKGCHLNIPPQIYNELHRGNELRMCPHCHRLIYVL